ncbi:Acetyltransferase (GNAT) family [Seminavis robusta]|uniref:Acetyltransferase (GNAT) family n=1 Tax=Seminavis robusta TaxID=568900 RepID=A0A9N8H1A9_9STRA|nr:Acetyltransferase (GNAT) family [Seminavis robusta]|eukprot:Sro13_g010360.1 Acetyltransferase (GNAT) family (206) ;mRNA; f:192570-193187
MSGTTTKKEPPMIEYPSLSSIPLKSAQDIVWQMLMHAAHENDLEQVKANSLLQPYAQDFGQQKGDIGVGAITKKQEDDEVVPIGAAWVRFLPGVGFATAHLKQKDGHDNDNKPEFQMVLELPELAIACLPEYRGMGVGSSLLKRLFEVVQQEKGGYKGICLSCRSDNPALRLYERVGFVNVEGSELTNRAGGTSLTLMYLFDKKE